MIFTKKLKSATQNPTKNTDYQAYKVNLHCLIRIKTNPF
jgi:hypothetical protein